MAQVYDNWDRLVRATLKKEELRRYGQRTPSDLSLSSSSSSSFNFSDSSRRAPFLKLPFLLVGEAFDYDQILRASNFLSTSNLIYHGGSGDLFTGVLDDGTRVVIKKIDSPYAESYCVSELETFGKISSHPRFVPLLGHCLDNNFKDNFFVYKYMSNRDLSSSLFKEDIIDPHDKFGLDQFSLKSLDWITRLKIAIGAAEALCYLHHECIPPLVHRDVQASSILLDDYYEVRLGRLGHVCAQEKDKGINQNRIAKFLRLAQGSKQGASGSVQLNATCAHDVYCFGKVLLELVTGNLGLSAAPANDSIVNVWMARTLPYINITDMELVTQIVDTSLVIDEDLLKEVWAMAVIAKACLNPRPSKRPLMTYVLQALENPLKVVNSEDSTLATSVTSVVPGPVGLPGSGGPVQTKIAKKLAKESEIFGPGSVAPVQKKAAKNTTDESKIFGPGSVAPVQTKAAENKAEESEIEQKDSKDVSSMTRQQVIEHFLQFSKSLDIKMKIAEQKTTL